LTTVKEKDFVEVEYTAKLKETGSVFDTTNEAIAKEQGIAEEGMVFGPLGIRIGDGALIKVLEEKLIGKEIGKDLEIILTPEESFGKKSAKLLKIVPTSAFTKQKIRPIIGMQINIDNQLGTVKTVAGGRSIVDFNHPLSGKDIQYDIKITRIITDDAEKIKNFVALQLNLKPEFFDVKIEEEKATISIQKELSQDHLHKDVITEKIKEFTTVKEVIIEKKK